jgi:putative addiction module component (TIGR02574 family)
MRAKDIPELDQLSTPEKILLVEDIWEQITRDETEVPVPQSHREEIERRLERYEKEPGRLLSHEELQQRIKARK